MFELLDDKPVTMQEILSKVTQEELWRYYCPNFNEINRPFKSSFYDDTNPSCRIIQTRTGKLYYKDFGTGHYISNVFDYVKFKYGCTWPECLNIVANDFNIRKPGLAVNRELKGSLEERLIIRPKTDIQILKQPFNIIDYNYWATRHLSLDDLDSYEVCDCKYVFLTNGRGCFKYEYRPDNPIYAYAEYDINLKFTGYRIYLPLADKARKWINNSTREAIQGIKQLPEKGKLLVITKSLKDVMVLRKLGYNAISLASETTPLSKEVYEILASRYDRIITLYDNDDTGIKYAKQMTDTHGIEAFFIPEEYDCKDIDELVVRAGLDEAKKLIKQLINE